MKRIVITTLLAVALLTGCTPTPEKVQIALQKDMEQVIEVASSGPKEPIPEGIYENRVSPLVERFGFPTSYKAQVQTDSDKMQITFDATVTLPMTAKLPTAKVRGVDFTQEQVSAYWNLFCKDTVMWNNRRQRTKAELEEEIQLLKARLEAPETYWEGTDVIQKKDTEDLKTQISWFEQQYKDAPETIEDTVCNGTLREIERIQTKTNKTFARHMGIDAVSDLKKSNGIWFFAANNDMPEKSGDVKIDGYEKDTRARIHFNSGRNRNNVAFNHPVLLLDDVIPEEAKGFLHITPAQAKVIAEGAIRATGSDDMQVQDVYIISNAHHEGNGVDDLEADKMDYVYAVTCVRTLNGVKANYLPDGSNFGKGALMRSWDYERLTFYIDDKGIYEMIWISPIEVREIMTDDTNLLPFEDIAETAEKMFGVKYGTPWEDLVSSEFMVNRIVLELQRITEKDSYENGLMIPVWSFYGTYVYKYKDNHTYSSGESQHFEIPLLTISAIDGSVIDFGMGY